MNRNELLGEINFLRSSIQQVPMESFIRKRLGANSLKDYEEKHIRLGKRLDTIMKNSDHVTFASLKEIRVFLENYNHLLTNIVGVNDAKYIEYRTNFVNALDENNEKFQEIWQQLVGVLTFTKDDESESILKELKQQLEEAKNLRNSLAHQAEEYKERYSNINANVELETQVNVFEAQAIKNFRASRNWLAGIIVSGIALIILLIVIYCNLNLPADIVAKYTDYNKVCESCGQQVLWVDMIRYLLFKLLLLSVNIYILSFCVKNYLASMHNKTNNEHRHNSFAAALHFYNTTTSERREEILHKVADAIFTYQKSGYYGKESEPANPSIVQNVIEKVTGKS